MDPSADAHPFLTRYRCYSFMHQVFPSLYAVLEHPIAKKFFQDYAELNTSDKKGKGKGSAGPNVRGADDPDDLVHGHSVLSFSRVLMWHDIQQYRDDKALRSQMELIALGDEIFAAYLHIEEVHALACRLWGDSVSQPTNVDDNADILGRMTLATLSMSTYELVHLFDETQAQAYAWLDTEVYPGFLKSREAAILMDDLVHGPPNSRTVSPVVKRKKSIFRRFGRSKSTSSNEKGSRGQVPVSPKAERQSRPLENWSKVRRLVRGMSDPDARGTAGSGSDGAGGSTDGDGKGTLPPFSQRRTRTKTVSGAPLSSMSTKEKSSLLDANVFRRVFPRLSQLLYCPLAIRYFSDYCKIKHSSENIDFLLAVQLFRQVATAQGSRQWSEGQRGAVMDQATEIYREFVANDAHSQVALCKEARDAAERVEDPSPTMFDIAYDEVFQTMNVGDFVHFADSASALDLLNELFGSLYGEKDTLVYLQRTFPLFCDFLVSPVAVRHLGRFFEYEFGGDMLRFWQAVNDFRNSYPDDSDASVAQVTDSAKRIYDTYLAPNAPHSVTVSAGLRKEIQDAMGRQEGDMYLFSEAAREVFELMFHSDYPRFLKSSEAQMLVSEMKKSAQVARLMMIFPTLSDLISIRTLAAQYFRKFLVTEYATETLDFYDEAEDYKQWANDPETRLQVARRIARLYLDEGSPDEVNISMKAKKATLELIAAGGELPQDLFKEAQLEVYLMLQHSRDRFIRSELAFELLSHLDRFSVTSRASVIKFDQNHIFQAQRGRGVSRAGVTARARLSTTTQPMRMTRCTSRCHLTKVTKGRRGRAQSAAPSTTHDITGEVTNGERKSILMQPRLMRVDPDAVDGVTDDDDDEDDDEDDSAGPGPLPTLELDAYELAADDLMYMVTDATVTEDGEEELVTDTFASLTSLTDDASEMDVDEQLQPASALPGSMRSNRRPSVMMRRHCGYCYEFVDPAKPHVFALDHVYHEGHFRCCVCTEPLSKDEFMVRDHKPYCILDFHRLFSALCAACGEPLGNKEHVSALYKEWHLACFACTHCKEPLDERYFAHSGMPYCGKHRPARQSVIEF